MQDIVTGLQTAITVAAGTLLLDGVESLALGNIRIDTNGISSKNSGQDINIGRTGDAGNLAVSHGIRFPDGSIQTKAAAQGPKGDQGEPGTPGGFGFNGSFYDTQPHSLTANVATAIPLNTTDFSNGVSILDGYKIKIANAGKYNLVFSSQLWNQASQRRNVTIWLSKNGITSDKWVPNSSTDIVMGTTLDQERTVAAWNFFVDAQANDFFVLMVVASANNVIVHGGTSLTTNPAGIPSIPSTILTVNQVG